MRVIIHDGKSVVNVAEVSDDWTGASGEWEPGEGLFVEVNLEAQIGWPIGGGGPAGSPLPPASPAQDLDDLKALARQTVLTLTNMLTMPILSRYPEAERAGWDKKEGEARSIIAASDKAAAISATSIIKALALAAGENTAATVLRADAIIAKADEFAAISAAVEVLRDQGAAAIDAVNDPADMPATLDSFGAAAAALASEMGLA